MRRAEGLWITLLLLGFTNAGKPDEQQILFSEGLQLFVEGDSSNSTAPDVLVLLPSPAELATTETVTLVCLIRGLLPGLVDIAWRINDTAVSTADSVAQGTREPDGSFSAVGLLSVATSAWNPRNNYRCVASQGSKVYEGSAQTSCYYG
ncbi:hypothetical protein AAFF_G00257950 [Aldrovandia affinis]|uniref:Ig-like domain-containing protein n=1 Tax=Aldrovandia affinis TaxID=143900 RepID=A0AAD7SV38_9TELE|nr:hypothetical protein AAFF_G00257950 [Aldrovandia affinis]